MNIVVYGASGFTGRLVLEELARRGIPAVLAGRDVERLRAAAVRVGAAAAVRVAAADDPAALAAAFAGSDVVISCVSPFARVGLGVARAAVGAGCHYVDTTGEQRYMLSVFDALAEPAARAGVSVVPALTDDGLPGDLVAHLVAARLGAVRELTIADLRTAGSPSRGTARSAMASLDLIAGEGLVYSRGAWREGEPGRRATLAIPDGDPAVPVSRFALPGVVTVPRHVDAEHVEGVIAEAAAESFRSVTPELVETMPEGPDAAARARSRWMMLVHATGADGRTCRGWVRGSDVYGTTAAVAVEGACRLATRGASPGVLAPAQAFDPAGFLELLAAGGAAWTVEDPVTA